MKSILLIMDGAIEFSGRLTDIETIYYAINDGHHVGDFGQFPRSRQPSGNLHR